MVVQCPQLRDLSLDWGVCPNHNGSILPAIGHGCQHLVSLALGCDFICRYEEFASLCELLGGQLEYLELGHIGLHACGSTRWPRLKRFKMYCMIDEGAEAVLQLDAHEVTLVADAPPGGAG